VNINTRTLVLTIVFFMVGHGELFGATPSEKSFCGIGVELNSKDDPLRIEKVIPGSGAEKAGVPVGSHIVSIEGKSVKGMALQDVVNLLRGAEGTVVSVTIVQELGLTKTCPITRIKMSISGPDNLAGIYCQQDDPNVLVIVERIANNQFSIKCPKQHWSGMGQIGNNCFKGVFQMEDNPEVHENFRGTVSFFRIDFEFGDRLRFRSKFNFFDSGDRMVEKTLVKKK
jgi:membrane-associated protease RseP (regulator of RpoE activity)